MLLQISATERAPAPAAAAQIRGFAGGHLLLMTEIAGGGSSVARFQLQLRQ